MTCEALVIGSVAGLALTAGVLSFQVLTDRKAAQKEDRKKIATCSTILLISTMKLYFILICNFILKFLVTTSNYDQFV